MADNEEIIRLIIDMKEGLERQIGELIERFDRMEARFLNQDARLTRHAALLQTGSRWTNRMNEWSEKIDQAMETRDRQIAELFERIRRLENERRSQQ